MGLGGIKGFSSQKNPWYVFKKDLDKNIIYVVQDHDNKMLYSKTLEINDISWINGFPPDKVEQNDYSSKSRYRQSEAKCKIKFIGNEKALITFFEPQWAITKGQSLVIYDNDVCLGGGIIC
ncbi:hypothetical protein CKCE_0260 [Candidatus Kinetoplastibacterium crithidii (ex Angomonas deanei ATCC 30255)]|nr:hypothetical protein CKCE_0260 [Candidatus Kinetoplastibacterium crithidii (ex Angomonas deanei ATCC 30255)]